MGNGATTSSGWRRVALLLLACALLLRVPAGWMPEARADGSVTLGWCSGTSHDVPEAATALIAKAMGDRGEKPAKPAAEQPCAFAAAAQPLAAADPAPAILPPAPIEAPAPARLALLPGRGLAAPPPLATGPPSFLV